MTMDLECEEPREKCEEIEAGIVEEMPEEMPEKKLYELMRSRFRRYRVSFVEFLFMMYLDVFAPKAKENVWWDVYPQEKGVVRGGGPGEAQG